MAQPMKTPFEEPAVRKAPCGEAGLRSAASPAARAERGGASRAERASGRQDAPGATVGRAATWAVRLCFALVFVVNVQCALQFALAPGDYTAGFHLSGTPGEAAVAGLGVAFLMWNATYPAFIAAPRRFSVLGGVILAQQFIGLLGEALILAGLPADEVALAASIGRFIAFDGAGLAIMAASFAWMLLCAKDRTRS